MATSGFDMYKQNNWHKGFWDFIDENKNKPFEWGTWDCCKFTDAMIQIMTGESLIPKELHWTDKKSAFVEIKRYGGDLLGAFAKSCKEKNILEINKNFIRCGDLCVYEGLEESYLVGFSDGINILGVDEKGITTEPHDKIVKAWRIEREPNG